ncbi:MAG: Gfo/Idh/MocA family protein [Anaerolineae bacterium]
MLKLGLLGAGFIGRIHAAALDQIDGVQLVAIADSNAQAADDLARAYHARAYETVEDLIQAPDIEVVDVCLPTFLHEYSVSRAAAEGKHIICEKPLALTKAEAERMAAAVDSAGVHFMVAQVLRFSPEYVAIKNLVQDQSLGRPLMTVAYRLEEPRAMEWIKDPALSGGAVLDLHVHDLDFLYSIFGMPQAVCAVGVQSDTGAWDHVVTSLDFAAVKGSAEASYLMPVGYPFSVGFRLVCTKGSVEYRSRVIRMDGERHPERSELMVYRPGQPAYEVDTPDTDGYLAELRYFVDCLNRGRRPTVATMAEALDVLDIVMAVQEALSSGRVVHLAS